MAGKASEARARRVVIGLDEDGRSSIVSDGLTETRLVTPAWTLNQIWQATSVPSHVMAENTLGDKAVIPPPPGGYTYVITTFPPDSEWDYKAGYAEALAEAGAADSAVDSDIPGLHETDTIDIVTIISGELWMVVESGETLMKPGDTLVQKGTKHAWQNRGDVPAVVAAIQIGATR
jgi:mannose-6-phosphate isomerase-like protein (cupin superfamily)